jgi:hypothetical protein
MRGKGEERSVKCSSTAKVKSCHVLTNCLTKPEPAIKVRLILKYYFIKRRIPWQRLK